jgi:tyrosyl-tRNA synthetase
MSKSTGNYIGINDPPDAMFGKTMSIPDEALPQWWELVAGGGEHPESPLEWKLELARRITARWHGDQGARAGEEHFTQVVRRGEAPSDVPDAAFEAAGGAPVYLPAVLQSVFGQSSSHWRRQIDQGGVKVNGKPPAGYELPPEALEGAVVQAGKRQFVRLHRA